MSGAEGEELRMRTRSILTVSAFCVAVSGLFIGAVPSSHADSQVPGFETLCNYSHTLKDDPIVNPGAEGGAHHLHDFAGNTTTTANSTVNSLRAGATNCENPDDTGAYWAPVLYQNSQAIHPVRLRAYYRWGQVDNLRSIQPFPAGLKMIAGDAHATAPQSTDVISWSCGVTGRQGFDHPITCSPDQDILLEIFFPNCWDGENLDSPDHRGHMAYSHFGSCPTSHPVPVPRLTEGFVYPTSSGRNITLSSGNVNTVHADFWNTWKQSALERLVLACIHTGRQCGPVTGPAA
jgi:hypothetical protein